MSLEPCKFYAQGRCRFGDNCRFYHGRTAAPAYAFGGGSQLFGSQQQETLSMGQKNQNQNLDTILEMVKKDMQEWEFGHIFPFSCYGPIGGKPCAPGFEEMSADELRYRFYVLNNKQPFDLSRELAAVQQARLNYLQISPATRNILERLIVHGEKIASTTGWSGASAGATQSLFGSSQSPSVFGGVTVQASPSPFTSSGTGLFGSGSVFGGQSAGIFGTNPSVAAQTSSIFGSGQTQNAAAFGNSAIPTNVVSQPNSIFGNNQATVQPQNNSIFGGTANNSSGFGSSTGLFGTTPSQASNAFGSVGGSTGVQTSIFGQKTGSIFGNPPVSSSQPIFGGPSLFGNSSLAQSTPSVFGTTANSFGGNTQPQQQTGGLFTSPSSNLFGQVAPTFGQVLQTQPTSLFGQQPPQSQVGQVKSPTLQGLLQTNQPLSTFSTLPTTPAQCLFGPKTSISTGVTSSGSFFSSSSQSQPLVSFGGVATPFTTASASTSLFAPPTSIPSSELINDILTTTPLFGNTVATPAQELNQQQFVYTTESELTPEELEAFRAIEFTLETIPTRPPPKSLCGR